MPTKQKVLQDTAGHFCIPKPYTLNISSYHEASSQKHSYLLIQILLVLTPFDV
jgi:hypothetical protein